MLTVTSRLIRTSDGGVRNDRSYHPWFSPIIHFSLFLIIPGKSNLISSSTKETNQCLSND